MKPQTLSKQPFVENISTKPVEKKQDNFYMRRIK